MHFVLLFHVPSCKDAENSDDKGLRFQFPEGMGGPIVNAAFEKKFISFKDGKWGAYATKGGDGGSVDWVAENKTIAIEFKSQSKAKYVGPDGTGEL